MGATAKWTHRQISTLGTNETTTQMAETRQLIFPDLVGKWMGYVYEERGRACRASRLMPCIIIHSICAAGPIRVGNKLKNLALFTPLGEGARPAMLRHVGSEG